MQIEHTYLDTRPLGEEVSEAITKAFKARTEGVPATVPDAEI
jgi:hypothetical protein